MISELGETWGPELQQTIYSAMDQLIHQDDDGEYRVGFPDEDDIKLMTGLEDLIKFGTSSQENATLAMIMLVSSCTHWFVEAMRERDPDEDPRLHLASLAVQLLTNGFGQNVSGDQ